MTKRILVVDDEVNFALFVRDACLAMGYSVEVSNDGHAAQALVASFKPDIIILDIVMPGFDGIEFLRWFMVQPHRARIILATGFNPRYADMAIRLGEFSHLEISILTKPLHLADLRKALGG